MRKRCKWFGVLAWLASHIAAGAAESPRAAAQVAGHYYLSGMTEVGSELILRPDGRYIWTFAYGASDRLSRGTWHQSGNKIDLKEVALPGSGPLRLLPQSDPAVIERFARPGYWVVVVGADGFGVMGDVNVEFKSVSGRCMRAVTDQKGVAAVAMPSIEHWRQVGVRIPKLLEKTTWVDLDKGALDAGLAVIALVDPKPTLPNMKLRIEADGLEVTRSTGPGDLGMSGRYRKADADK